MVCTCVLMLFNSKAQDPITAVVAEGATRVCKRKGYIYRATVRAVGFAVVPKAWAFAGGALEEKREENSGKV